MSRPDTPTLAEVDQAHIRALSTGHNEELKKPGSRYVQYLQERGIKPETMLDVGGGFLLESLNGQHIQTESDRAKMEIFVRSGLGQWDISEPDEYGRKDYRWRPTFAGRLTFPMLDAEGNVRGWVGRSVDGTEPRYLRSRAERKELDRYGQSVTVESEAYPLMVFPGEGADLLICEGLLDGLIAWQHVQEQGLSIRVAATGGCDVYPRQAREVIRLLTPTGKILIAFDQDEAKFSESEQDRGQTVPLGRGQRGASKLATLLATIDERLFARISMVAIAGGKDLADALAGGQALTEVLDRRRDVVDFALDQLRGTAPQQVPGGLADTSLLQLPDAIWQLGVLPRVEEWVRKEVSGAAVAKATIAQIKKAAKLCKPYDVSRGQDEPDADGRLPLLLDKQGKPKSSLDSLVRVFAHSDIEVRFDELARAAQIRTPKSRPNQSEGWEHVTDSLLHGLMRDLEREYGTSWSEQTCWQAISAEGGENRHHPVRAYLDRCRDGWDGQSRIEVLLLAMGIANDGSDEAHWARTAVVKSLISAAKRVYEPGSQRRACSSSTAARTPGRVVSCGPSSPSRSGRGKGLLSHAAAPSMARPWLKT